MRLPLPVLAVLFFAGLAPAGAADSPPTPAAVAGYLTDHAHQPGVTVRPSGLQVRVLKSGIGRHVGPHDNVQIYYTARLADGRVVDGSSPGLPAPIDLSNTLAGLGEALQTMREGDRWELTLPPALAFGAKGGGNGTIPPNQALIFDLTVVSSQPAPPGGAALSDGLSIAAGNGESHAYWTIHP